MNTLTHFIHDKMNPKANLTAPANAGIIGRAGSAPAFRLILLPVLTLWLMAPAELFAQRSLYSDVRAHRPGDVITIILTENITGTSSLDQRSRTNRNGSASSEVSGTMLPVNAVFGAGSRLDFQSDERALSNQSQLLSGTLSVRIQDIDGNGNYRIDGSRRTEISGEIYKMTLSGLVRPEDINEANEVFSFRVAEADILYLNEGGFRAETRKRGFRRTVLWGAVGLITGVTAVLAIN